MVCCHFCLFTSQSPLMSLSCIWRKKIWVSPTTRKFNNIALLQWHTSVIPQVIIQIAGIFSQSWSLSWNWNLIRLWKFLCLTKIYEKNENHWKQIYPKRKHLLLQCTKSICQGQKGGHTHSVKTLNNLVINQESTWPTRQDCVEIHICIYTWSPNDLYFFEESSVEPLKKRQSPTKRMVIWVFGIYIYGGFQQ